MLTCFLLLFFSFVARYRIHQSHMYGGVGEGEGGYMMQKLSDFHDDFNPNQHSFRWGFLLLLSFIIHSFHHLSRKIIAKGPTIPKRKKKKKKKGRNVYAKTKRKLSNHVWVSVQMGRWGIAMWAKSACSDRVWSMYLF